MPVDNARYQSLIERAAFRCEPFRGTIQDLSPAQRTMSFVGSPSFARIAGLPCLKQNVAGADGTTSAVIPSFLDPTAPFSVEAVFVPYVGGVDIGPAEIIIGQSTLGGFYFFWYPAANSCWLRGYTNAGAFARDIRLPASSIPKGRATHVLVSSTVSMTAGTGWVNGIPATPTLAGAGVVASSAAAAILCMGAGNAISGVMLVRAFPFALTNEDAQCLSEAAKLLVGGW